MKLMRSFVVAAIALSSLCQIGLGDVLYTQGPHIPGAEGGNGSSSFLGSLDAGVTTLDRQFADDFVVTGQGWTLNSIDTSWVQSTVADTNAVTNVVVEFFSRTGSGGVGGLVAAATGVTVNRTTGPGTYFGRPEQILTASFDDLAIAPGEYFLKFQPIVDHNWFWVSSSPTTSNLSPAHYRRGPLTTAGLDATWPTDWTAAGNDGLGFVAGPDLSFTLHGFVNTIPEPGSLSLLVLCTLIAFKGVRPL